MGRNHGMSKNLFIAVPVYGAVDVNFHHSCLRLFSESNLAMTYRHHPGCPNISSSRNILVGEFLKTDCDRMLFIDSDMGFEPWQVERMAAQTEDVVAGLYCCKQPGAPRWTVRPLQPGQEFRE